MGAALLLGFTIITSGNRTYLILCISTLTILGVITFIPDMEKNIPVSRAIQLAFFVVSPLFIVGVERIVDWIKKRRIYLIGQ